MKISDVTVRVVAPPVARSTWAYDLPEQYMTMVLVTIRTDEGLEGYGCTTTFTDQDFDRAVGESLRPLLSGLIGADPLAREALWQQLRPRTLPISFGARAAVDIALWDILGKVAGLPLYQILGGMRNRIRSYASTPLLPDMAAYMAYIDDVLAQGFRGIKFHAWGLPDKDLELCRAVRRLHPEADIEFMFDAEGNYDYIGALRTAQELEALGFRWLEAPLPDADLAGYRELTRRVNIQILPAGNWVLELPAIAEAIETKAWGAVRIDAGTSGGLTPARKILNLAEAAGLTTEVQSWSYTLQQAANLHLVCAFPNCTYFEQPVPYEAFEYGAKNFIRTQSDGYVYAPTGPGLGIELDWDALEKATILKLSSGN